MNELKDIPYSIEAEASVLGTMIADPRTIDDVVDAVSAEDFYRLDNRLIFSAILDIHAKGEEPDVVTLVEALRGEGVETAYIGGLVKNAYRSGNALSYAAIVRSKSIDRRLMTAAKDIFGIADSTATTPEKIDRAQSLVMAIEETANRDRSGPVPVKSLLTKVVDDLEERLHKGSAITGTPTGFKDFDEMTAGLQPADLIIVAGRPSMGKTSFAMNIAENVAETGPVAVFSMEMPKKQITERSICSIGKINFQRFRSGQLWDEEWPKVTAATARIMESGMYVDDTPALTVHELSSRARRLHRQSPLSLVVVDYLQLMQGDGDNQNLKIASISGGLKKLAKELNVPVIALSQLNRSLENRANKRPVMSDLRESGAIEQDADLIAFLYRDEVYDKDSPDKGTAEVIIGKQRNGPTGTVRMTFLGYCVRFENFIGEVSNAPKAVSGGGLSW